MGSHAKELLDARVYAVEFFYSHWGISRRQLRSLSGANIPGMSAI
jgi:hypothetical protein